MLIGWRAAAEQLQRFGSGVPKLVSLSRWNRNRVTGLNFADLVLNSHSPVARSDEINFLGPRMIMFLRAAAHRDASFGQTLVANDRVPVRQQFPDF